MNELLLVREPFLQDENGVLDRQCPSLDSQNARLV
jgi:hypothetical protein